MIAVLIGPSSCGKTTQGQFIEKKFGLPGLVWADVLKNAVNKNDTEASQEAKELLQQGEKIPGIIAVEIIRERITHPDCADGFSLEGFPKNMEQVCASPPPSPSRLLPPPPLPLPNPAIPNSRCAGTLARPKLKPPPGPYRQPQAALLDGMLHRVNRQINVAICLDVQDDEWTEQNEPLLSWYSSADKLAAINGNMYIEEVQASVADVLRSAGLSGAPAPKPRPPALMETQVSVDAGDAQAADGPLSIEEEAARVKWIDPRRASGGASIGTRTMSYVFTTEVCLDSENPPH